jgi:hypothetical protein
MVRPYDGDFHDDLPSYSGAGHNEYPAEFDQDDQPEEPPMTVIGRIKLDLNRVEYLAEALIWCEDSPQVQAALNDLAITRERLQADLQRVTLNPNAVTVGRY